MSMPSSRSVRAQIEAALAGKIPSAFTPQSHAPRSVAPTGIGEIDALLHGGLPAGAISEIVGGESSGRTSLALAFMAGITRAEKVCAWVDVSNTLHLESAAAIGVDVSRMLWVRCGVESSGEPRQSFQPELALPGKYTVPPKAIKGLHGGGFGPHPRTEARGLSTAASDLLGSHGSACALPSGARHGRKLQPQREDRERQPVRRQRIKNAAAGKPWLRLEQALRVTDLLLQAGGFAAIALDMGSIEPEHALRVPLATWFRFRAAAERTQINFLLLTQHACAKNSACLVLRLDQGAALTRESTIFTGMEHRAELDRSRLSTPSPNVLPLRKPPQSQRTTVWRNKTSWTGSA